MTLGIAGDGGDPPAVDGLIQRGASVAVKFAVVREDPQVELAVIDRLDARRALLVASGGCTALAIASDRPEVALTLYDFNPDQLAHVEARARAVADRDLVALGIDDDDVSNLSQCGAFEALFRILATAVRELVVDRERLEAWFARGAHPQAATEARSWFSSPYWEAVFHVAFNDALLVAMFGPDAVQHAPRGSYPGYFRRVFERGLTREDGPHNPFLQHILLGRYLGRDAPSSLTSGITLTAETQLGGLPDVADLDRYDLVHVSNIFDWSDDAQVRAWCVALRRLHPGAAVVVRQLNNDRDIASFLGPWFDVDEAFGATLHRMDRSLFYDRIIVAYRTEHPA